MVEKKTPLDKVFVNYVQYFMLEFAYMFTNMLKETKSRKKWIKETNCIKFCIKN